MNNARRAIYEAYRRLHVNPGQSADIRQVIASAGQYGSIPSARLMAELNHMVRGGHLSNYRLPGSLTLTGRGGSELRDGKLSRPVDFRHDRA